MDGREHLVNGNDADHQHVITARQQLIEARTNVMRQHWAGRKEDQYPRREKHDATMTAFIGAGCAG
jgi:sRNA-binding protein